MPTSRGDRIKWAESLGRGIYDVNDIAGVRIATEFSSIQTMIDDFGANNGIVMVPSNYTGANATIIPTNVQVFDFRNGTFRVFTNVGGVSAPLFEIKDVGLRLVHPTNKDFVINMDNSAPALGTDGISGEEVGIRVDANGNIVISPSQGFSLSVGQDTPFSVANGGAGLNLWNSDIDLMRNNIPIRQRNLADTAGVRVIYLNSSDRVQLGANDSLQLGAEIHSGNGVIQFFIDPDERMQLDATGTLLLRRLRASNATTHITGDYALSAGWGTSPSVSSVAANDHGGRVTITSGTGTPSTNPTVALTFKDGTWTNPPSCAGLRGDINSPTASWALTSITATVATWTFQGTPAVSTAYILDFICIGR